MELKPNILEDLKEVEFSPYFLEWVVKIRTKDRTTDQGYAN